MNFIKKILSNSQKMFEQKKTTLADIPPCDKDSILCVQLTHIHPLGDSTEEFFVEDISIDGNKIVFFCSD